MRANGPDLNPIEQVFAKLKTLPRKANARTIDAVREAIGQIPDGYAARACIDDFVNSGYGSA